MTKSKQTLPGLMTFVPYLKKVIWGGCRIAQFKGKDIEDTNIGESMEISGMEGYPTPVAFPESLAGRTLAELIDEYGEAFMGKSLYARYGGRFPLLIKYIDAASPLSLQVHPDDDMARRVHDGYGKDEAWFIVEAKDGAVIHCGLDGNISRADFDRYVEQGRIFDKVNQHTSTAGQFYYIPSGTLHAIGAGNLIAEIQQSSDVTYRVYDYDRKDSDGKLRELHTELAAEAVCGRDIPKVTPHVVSGDSEEFVCPHFAIQYRNVDGDTTIECREDSFSIFMVVKGNVCLRTDNGDEIEATCGTTVLAPAFVEEVEVSGDAELLRIYAR